MVTGDYSLLLIKSHQRGPKFFLYNFIYFPPFQKLSFLPGIGLRGSFKICLYYLLSGSFKKLHKLLIFYSITFILFYKRNHNFLTKGSAFVLISVLEIRMCFNACIILFFWQEKQTKVDMGCTLPIISLWPIWVNCIHLLLILVP